VKEKPLIFMSDKVILNPMKTMIMITTARGLENTLRSEVAALGLPVLWAGSSGVKTEGTMVDAMRLNLHTRTGHRVLFLIKSTLCRNADDLYREVYSIPWETLIPADGYVSVSSHIANETIRDNRYANLRCKDAVVDRIKERKGVRPDAGPEQTGAVVNLYWRGDECDIYLDTSGEPLSKRGYRKIPLDAPMQETLAAGVIMTAGWGTSAGANFINPMCGSGTLAIEAALIALKRPAGLVRPSFGFMQTLLFDKKAWEQVRAEAVSAKVDRIGKIIASDINPAAVDAARRNAETAGVAGRIEFSVCDISETAVPEGGGIVVVNPEYGVRLGEETALVPTYRKIGEFFKKKCRGYGGYMFTGSPKLAGQVGLKSKRRITFMSGSLECRLYQYDLY
jgi:putative N6-adenine-specific DNA methylase